MEAGGGRLEVAVEDDRDVKNNEYGIFRKKR
jgi:hypothetical protein